MEERQLVVVMLVEVFVIRPRLLGPELLVSSQARLASPLLCAVGTDGGCRDHLLDLSALTLRTSGLG